MYQLLRNFGIVNVDSCPGNYKRFSLSFIGVACLFFRFGVPYDFVDLIDLPHGSVS